MSGPDYRQAEEAQHERWDEERLRELELKAQEERDEKFRRDLEAKYPQLLGAWPGRSK